MRRDFDSLMQELGFLLADGATGTNLFAAGLQSGDAPELWNRDHPERISALHQGFIDAGADLILTNSFGGNCYRLQLHGAQDDVADLNRRAAEIAGEAAARAARPVVVAGSIGPTGEILAPLGSLSHQDAADAFAEQAEALKAGGVDVLWIETMSSREEVEAAVEGCAGFGLPVACTLSFDTNGRTMMGISPAEFVAICRQIPARPHAFGANCGLGAAEAVAGLLNFARAADPGDLLVSKANCGVPAWEDGAIRYDGTPELMASYARLARDAGARVIGGCCGTTPEHLRAMRDALDGYQPGTPPTLDEVVAALGDVTHGARSLGLAPEDLPDAVDATRVGRAGRGRRGRGRDRARDNASRD